MSDSAVESSTDNFLANSENARGVSIQGKSLKLDKEHDCKEVIEAIEACKNLEYLNLEGNTLGVEASKAISKALESKSELKRALWKDMFTGRMKEEIPNALKYLGNGLTLAKAKLTELELSDNAFGPIGVSGLASLITSPSCYQLQELKLNNNGLGVSGGKMLAEALLQCHKNSANEGKALALKLLIIGRNRLENEGAAALAEVIQTLGSLEEISIPQNGIYHKGIKALSNAFKKNKDLRVIDLNDNTITKKGANHIADALPHLQKLKILLLEDCLLRNDGATILANALSEKHVNLEELDLSFNEIRSDGGLEIAKAMSNKSKLKKLNVNGNHFGTEGMTQMKQVLAENKRLSALGTLSDDVSFEKDDDDDDEEGSSSQEDEDSHEDDEEEEEKEQNGLSIVSVESSINEIKSPENSGRNILSDFIKELSIRSKPESQLKTFLDNPTEENFSILKESEIDKFIAENQDESSAFYMETFIPLLVKISSLSNSQNEEVRKCSLRISQKLYEDLFKWATSKNRIPIVNNVLFVYFGLIKSEDKSFKINWNVKGSLSALNSAISKGTIPTITRDTLSLLTDKESREPKHGSNVK